MSQDNDQRQTETKTTGRVKWFNNSSGYGFITAIDGAKTGEDVFVHHSGLMTDEEQYKYLVAGEYVEFEWTEANDSGTHKWQATSIKGVGGGKLMCETHKEQRLNNDNLRRPSNVDDNKQPRYRGGGPRTLKDTAGKEWMLVPKTTTRIGISRVSNSRE
jgi:cold shock CspA family protein